jgi:hypothetical protein
MLSTHTKSNGPTITLGPIENQNSSIVMGNLADSIVLPILFLEFEISSFAGSFVVKDSVIHVCLLSIKILYIVDVDHDSPFWAIDLLGYYVDEV